MAEQILRCPYCILNGQPRPMLLRPVWTICTQCGHIVMPQYADFKCSCRECLERPATQGPPWISGHRQ
jgi:hypothetical protein